jgi:hypothetical protein
MSISDRREMGEVGRKFIQENFSQNTVVEQWKKTYQID